MEKLKIWFKIFAAAVIAFFAWLAYFLSGKRSGRNDRYRNNNGITGEFEKSKSRIRRERIQNNTEREQIDRERTDIEGERESIEREGKILDRDEQLLSELEKRHKK